MLKMLELREIIRLVNQSSIDELEIENGGVKISLKKAVPVLATSMTVEEPAIAAESAFLQAAAAQETPVPVQEKAAVEQATAPALHTITSPVVGIFSASPQPGAAPYVQVGQKIAANTVVCSCNVKVLNLSHEIKSEVSGEIVEVLAEEGQLIEYGQPLFKIKPE